MKGLCAAGSTCAGKSLPKSARWTGRPNLLALIDESLLSGVIKVINKLLVDRVARTGFDRWCKTLPTPTGGAVVVAGSVPPWVHHCGIAGWWHGVRASELGCWCSFVHFLCLPEGQGGCFAIFWLLPSCFGALVLNLRTWHRGHTVVPA